MALCMAVVAAACSGSGEVLWPAGPSDLVLRVVNTGGLVPPGSEFQLPALSLYGDGLLILPGKPAGSVAHLRLTVDGVRRVVRAAVSAGLAKEQDYGSPQILDAPASFFTLVTDKRHESVVVAPFELSVDNPVQTEARRRVHTFRKALNDLDSWLGDDIGPVTTPEPGPYLVFGYQTSEQGQVVEWPFGELQSSRCQLLSGEQARVLVRSTLWRSGDNVFRLVARPLLPDEKSCADVRWIR